MSGWIGLEPSDMPDGENPMYDHPFFIQGIVWAATKLFEKNHMIDDDDTQVYQSELEAAAKAAIEAEREKVAAWMIERSYATGHGDTTEDLLKELEWQVRESEREACAKVCDDLSDQHSWEGCYADECAEAIRARGQG
jgi:hypothetical protein